MAKVCHIRHLASTTEPRFGSTGYLKQFQPGVYYGANLEGGNMKVVNNESGKIFLVASIITVVLLALIFTVPNPLGKYFISEAKANGFLEYEPLEAYELANEICTQCHSVERIKLYCPRCGPPFVAVVPHMQTFILNYQKAKPDLKYRNITETQAVAIAQVWNAVVGNWEADFREQDIIKLIGNYQKLIALYKTPVKERTIEVALAERDDLKIGHMSNLEEMQKDLGKPENNPQNPCASTDTSGTGSGEMDHSKMDHSKMDHSKMDH